jgi:NAD(P)-dependent dehydrogenase (short-subunit alcohol dehydrogenase family)
MLVNRIASLIAPGGRLVNVSSAGHCYSDVDLDDPNFERAPYDPVISYGRSKTANILFAVEFDRRHRARGVRATTLHPGGILTELGRHLQAGELEATVERINAELAAEGRPPFQFKTIPQGAATSVWAAVVASTEEVGGRYCEDCQVSQVTEGLNAAPTSPKETASTNCHEDIPEWRPAEAKLRKHWSLLGFRQLPGSDVFALFPNVTTAAH